MHICHVITRLIVGGAQENTLLSCRGLHERGHEVTLIAGPETGPEGSLWDDARAIGCRLITMPELVRAVRPWSDFRAHRALIRQFRLLKPDVVHTHSSKAGILGRSAAKRAGVPVVIHTIHGMSFNRTQGALTRLAYVLFERRAARCTTAFVSVSDAMTRQSIEARIAPPHLFRTIRSGMQTDRFRPSAEIRTKFRERHGIDERAVIVGTVARLFQNKGYEELIAAMTEIVRAVPNTRFVWVGDGLNRDEYLRHIESLGLRDRVVLTGLVPPSELPSILPAFDLLVHASRWEGLARVQVQAMLCEVPVVSLDLDGAPEVVIPNQTGLLVPDCDTQALARAVIDLAGSRELRQRMGRAGRERCLTMFDWRDMVRQLEALYAEQLLTGTQNKAYQ